MSRKLSQHWRSLLSSPSLTLSLYTPRVYIGDIFALVASYIGFTTTCSCIGIHPGRVEPAPPIALTTSRTEAFQAQRSCARSVETFTQPIFHRAWPKTCGPESGSRFALIVVAHVFSWPPARLHHLCLIPSVI